MGGAHIGFDRCVPRLFACPPPARVLTSLPARTHSPLPAPAQTHASIPQLQKCSLTPGERRYIPRTHIHEAAFLHYVSRPRRRPRRRCRRLRHRTRLRAAARLSCSPGRRRKAALRRPASTPPPTPPHTDAPFPPGRAHPCPRLPKRPRPSPLARTRAPLPGASSTNAASSEVNAGISPGREIVRLHLSFNRRRLKRTPHRS